MTKVYIASKLKHAGRWSKLRTELRAEGIDLHARWIDQSAHEDSAMPEDFKMFWMVDHEDVKNCDALIVYGEPGESLKGALIETGIGIALGRLTFVVGECESFGTWTHHPFVTRAATLEFALRLIKHRFGAH